MKKLTPGLAIKWKCLDCNCYSMKEARDCGFLDCPLHQYRLGKNPHRSGHGITANLKMTDSTKKTPTKVDCPIVSAKNEESGVSKDMVTYPLKSIRRNCLSCMNGNQYEVAKCPSLFCPTYLFRFGRKPTLNELDDYLRDHPILISRDESDEYLIRMSRLLISAIKKKWEDYDDGV